MFKEHVYFIVDPKVVVTNISSEARAKRVLVNKPNIINRHPSAPLSGDAIVHSASNGDKPSPVPENPTVLPTSFLRTMCPVCLFRHPARMFESYYRAAVRGGLSISIHDEDFPVNTSLRWIRLLHDWYSSIGDVPVTLEADDFINEESVMPKFCKALGLDPKYLQTRWDKVLEEKRALQGTMATSFQQTMQNSTGIIRSKKRDTEINNDQERERWANEFGEDFAAALYGAAEAAMPDYIYLRSKRLV